MRFHREPIEVSEAQKKILSFIEDKKIETVKLLDSEGRRLAREITATSPVPHFDKSPYDGFAVRAADTSGATAQEPVYLTVVGTIACGDAPDFAVAKGQAARIMTGAALPEGADAVIMFEMTTENEAHAEKRVGVKKEMSPGENVIKYGEEAKEGDFLIPAGKKIGPGEMAILATFGYAEVPVFHRPRVGVLATGSELLTPDQPLSYGKIRNSNSYMVISQVKQAGGEPILYPSLEDNPDAAEKTIRTILGEVDILITTGGVSVGDFDVMVEVFKRLEVELLFNKIAMRPGSVTSCARFGNKMMFGLSGNPGACFVGFELFVRPYLQAVQGKSNPLLPQMQAYIGKDMPKPSSFTRFVRGKWKMEDGKPVAYPVGLDKSAAVTNITDANCLIQIQPAGRGIGGGDAVLLHLLPYGAGE
ncbi:molybdopterin molybdotransferase MoeA [Aneurinibacillus sp. Ricciae_BoGa-3]|uniref:molybdopterin molybdotransferase MoeA n=1 Tax=Aneurinibacillus sp. Ricciae_BoGa-3 TaxID=3022697 RepID=UPI00233FB65E|nr:gephyrin-like molybdotransferase Glp [Aneurinibacillus sp. Ricciae_BoGa-3]WCK52433.1 molybdopterin molybdotransferase MoeA [Aneurinibacillus sp. Ricciae_BoGa-3]